MNLLTRWRQRQALIGIDLGPDAVRLLQLSGRGTDLQVSHYACEPLPPGAMDGDQIINLDAVGEAVARARIRSGTHARHAVVALAAPAAVLHLLSTPVDLRESELEAQLELEAARLLPAANSSPFLDFEVLGQMPDDPGQVQVLLAVAHPAPVRHCMAALKYGGLNPVAVDVDALALARALAVLVNQSLPAEQMIALNRDNIPLPEHALSMLAHTIPSEDIARNAPALLLVCGLALRKIRT